MLILRPFGPRVVTTQFVYDTERADGNGHLCIGKIMLDDGAWTWRASEEAGDLRATTLREIADLMEQNR